MVNRKSMPTEHFPTATIEALIQQNKTLSAKLSSLLSLCRSQEEQIKDLSQKYENLQAKEAHQSQNIEQLKASYQKLQAVHQKFKENLKDAEKQFALQYTDFLEKQQAWKAEGARLNLRLCLLTKYRRRIHKRVRPYLERLKEEIASQKEEHRQQGEKLCVFQKQLKEAYTYIQKMALDSKGKEKAFREQVKKLKAQISEMKSEHQLSQQTSAENKFLKEQLLSTKNRLSTLQTSLNRSQEEKMCSEKAYVVEVEKLKSQVQTLTTQKEYLAEQLKLLQDTLKKTEGRQSHVNLLWQKKLALQMEKVLKMQTQKGLADQSPIERKGLKSATALTDQKKASAKHPQDFHSYIHEAYQTTLSMQAGLGGKSSSHPYNK